LIRYANEAADIICIFLKPEIKRTMIDQAYDRQVAKFSGQCPVFAFSFVIELPFRYSIIQSLTEALLRQQTHKIKKQWNRE